MLRQESFPHTFERSHQSRVFEVAQCDQTSEEAHRPLSTKSPNGRAKTTSCVLQMDVLVQPFGQATTNSCFAVVHL